MINTCNITYLKNLSGIIALFSFSVLCFPSFAEWPTEPSSGLVLTTFDAQSRQLLDYAVSDDNSVIACIRADRFMYTEDESRWYILTQKIMPDGTLLWPLYPDEDHYVTMAITDNLYEYPFRAVQMAYGQQGSTFIAWSDSRNANWDPYYHAYTGAGLRLQKLDENGVNQWGTDGIIIYERTEYLYTAAVCAHLEPQEDDGVLVVWYDYDSPSEDYEGNIWVYRYDADGNMMWEDSTCVLLDNPGIPHQHPTCVSDGEGGVMILVQNRMLKVSNEGEILWEYGDVVFWDLRYGRADAYEMAPGFAMILGWTPHSDTWITGITNEGILPFGDGREVPHIEHSTLGEVFTVGDEYYGFVMQIRNSEVNATMAYYLYDDSLNTVLNHDYRLLSDTSLGFQQFTKINSHGIRFMNRLNIDSYDYLANYNWTHAIEENESMINNRSNYLDDLGNTWIFWSSGDDYYNWQCVANIINPAGERGVPILSPVWENSDEYLPESISIQTWPNPFNNHLTISIENLQPGNTTLSVYNILGQHIINLHHGWLPAGYHRFLFTGDQLPSGVYLLVSTSDEGISANRRIVLMK